MKQPALTRSFLKGFMAFVLFFSFSFAAFAAGGEGKRKIVVRVLQGHQMELQKEKGPAVLGFACLPGDSIRIHAFKCKAMMDPDGKYKENVRMYIRSNGETVELQPSDFEGWVDIPGNTDRAELVIERLGKGSKTLEAGDLTLWRKTDEGPEATSESGWARLEVQNLFFGKVLFR